MKFIIGVISAAILTGCGGGDSEDVVPTIQFHAEAMLDGTTRLSWSSTGADQCKIDGSHTENVGTSGSRYVKPLHNANQSYSFTCSNASKTTQAIVNPSNIRSFEEKCAMSTGGWKNYFHVGEFMVGNSTWPSAVASTENPVHCISASVSEENVITSNARWSFDQSEGIKTNQGWLYGIMPEYGAAGQGIKNTTEKMPKRIIDITDTYGVTYENRFTNVNTSNYNLLIDLYFSEYADASVQSLELSINQICVSVCSGVVVDSVVIDGVSYNVRLGYPYNGGGVVRQVSFSSNDNPLFTGTVRFMPFIRYVIDKGYLDESHYLNSFAVSNEVYSGSAESMIISRINE